MRKKIKIISFIFTIFLFVFSFGGIVYANPVFTVNNSTPGEIVFSGTGLVGISEIRVLLTKTTTSQIQSATRDIVNNSFSGLSMTVAVGQAYTYTIIDTGNGNTLKTDGFTAMTTPVTPPTTTPVTPPTTTPVTPPTTTPNTDPILLENPLKGIGSIPELIEVILKIVFKIGSWVLAMFIIYVGYMFVAAKGKPEDIQKAKEALKYTLIGGAILLGAFVIAEAIVGTVTALQ